MGCLLAVAALPAMAADTVVEQPAPMPERFGWTGGYVGLIGGIGGSSHDFGLGPTGGAALANASVTGNGGFIGGQIGYDWQIGSFVVGGVADIAASNIGASLNAAVLGVAVSASSRIEYLGTVRARLGYSWDRVLIYGHGGFAYGGARQNIAAAGVTLFNGRQSKTGWTIGAGVEFAAFDNVSIGAEYGYVDLGRSNVFTGGGATVTERITAHTGKLSINYRF